MAEQEKDNTQQEGGSAGPAGQSGQAETAKPARDPGKNKSASKKAKKPAIIARARYTGNSPVKVKQGERAVMLWPNQVYKDLEETEDVAFLIKKRMLKKIK